MSLHLNRVIGLVAVSMVIISLAPCGGAPCVVVKKHEVTDHFQNIDRMLLIYCVLVVSLIVVAFIIFGISWCYYRRRRFQRAYSMFRVDTPPGIRENVIPTGPGADVVTSTGTMHSCESHDTVVPAVLADRR